MAGAAALAVLLPLAAHADALRPAIAKPLEAAEHALAAHKFELAEKALGQAQAVPGKTDDESFTIAQVRAAIDASRQDYAAAASDYAALIASGRLGADQVHTMAEAEASSDYSAGNYAGAIATINRYLPHDAQFTSILLQSYLKQNDCAGLAAAVAKLPKPPAEADLQMVAFCTGSAKDLGAYTAAETMLVKYYPTPENWQALLGVAKADPAFSDALALDFFRLKQVTGAPATEPEYMEMTQTALQAGLPNEAARIMAAGKAAGVIGSGPDVDRQNRLAALVAKQQAAPQKAFTDAPSQFAAGFNAVDAGNPAGLAPMAAAIRSGQLTQPGQAELELGIAYAEAGQKANADAMWNAVQGGDGPLALAKLWLLVK